MVDILNPTAQENGHLQKLEFFFRKHYGNYFADYFKDVCEYQKQVRFYENKKIINKVKNFIKRIY